ncbi:DUF4149 domain-containing protein [Massilia horti]|uniref:DUF4149 domain-containing protein n=1 Tax=Massilia horti TaxID=2562153 RepID=A0A4Y9SQ47_9BURK|nr:DUF4149 domain-containing protein [Massilia horti]TFW28668.1 DUF4149 domain-containing protein [Massilia horti]
MKLAAARRLVASLWAGSLWAVGYLVAPTLFAHVDSSLAGEMVGHLLRSEAWLSIACALAMLALLRLAAELEPRHRRQLVVVVLAMLACTLVVYLGLQPVMAQLREAAGAGGVRNSPQWGQFAMLHGLSQLIYVTQSVLGVVLVVRIR